MPAINVLRRYAAACLLVAATVQGQVPGAPRIPGQNPNGMRVFLDLKNLFDESNEAVMRLIRSVIETAHAAGRKVGLCGQAPSDKPAFVEFLVDAGIDSVSVTADSFVRVKANVAAAERQRERSALPSA